MSVDYWPIVCLESGEAVGFQATPRWYRPELGWIPVEQFLPRAVELGVIHSIGDLILDCSLDFVSKLLVFHSQTTVALTVTGRQLEREDFAASVADALTRWGVPGSALSLEMGESALENRRDECLRSLVALSEIGVGICLSEFGDGKGSLNNLLDVPVTSLRISRSVVGRCLDDPQAQRQIHCLVAMAHSLGVRVTADGIESQAQRNYMRSAGCETGQGSGLSVPLWCAELGGVPKAA